MYLTVLGEATKSRLAGYRLLGGIRPGGGPLLMPGDGGPLLPLSNKPRERVSMNGV